MSGAWLAATVLLPLALAALLAWPRALATVVRLAPLAPLPAIVLALGPAARLDVDWILVGVRLQSGPVEAPLLLLFGVLWFAASIYAADWFRNDASARRYWLFHLLTLAANAGVLIAGDLVSFYTCYALLTLAVYALVIHHLDPPAWRAGRVYLVMALAAEALLVAAVLLIGAQAGNAPLVDVGDAVLAHPYRNLLTGLVIAGFAVKMGCMPLHVWLPLAHPQAPVPASAVLSGVIVKAGLVGWMRLLPLGDADMAGVGALFIVAGLATAFTAATLGVFQARAKGLLAYSTVSQMGLLTALVGVGLAESQLWPVLLPVVGVFALHHGLAKGALFLACGVQSRARTLFAALPAISLAGAPLTGGALAKSESKRWIESAPGAWGDALPWLFLGSSLFTTLLMARLLWLLATTTGSDRSGATGRLVVYILSPAAVVIPWAWAARHAELDTGYALSTEAMLDAAWPFVIGTVIAVLTVRLMLRSRHGRQWPTVPEGDLLVLLPARLPRIQAPAAIDRLRLMVPWERLGTLVARGLLHTDRRHLGVGTAGALLLLTALVLALAVAMR